MSDVGPETAGEASLEINLDASGQSQDDATPPVPKQSEAVPLEGASSPDPPTEVVRTHVVAASEPPKVPGLSEMIDEWQIAGTPEETQFFSTEGNVFEASLSAIRARLDERDSNIRKSWLLTEINHWDWEKERVVLLTDSNIISVKFNFIQQVVEELKYIPLAYVKEIIYGDFQYPYSYAHTRKGKGLKIVWNKQDVGFWSRWNIGSSTIPYTILTSHILIRRNRSQNPVMQIESVPVELERAMRDFRSRVASAQQTSQAASAPEEFSITESDIVIDYYFGLSALVHNQSYLGFFKKRGAINW